MNGPHQDPVQAHEVLRKFQLSEEMVRAHDVRPPHLANATSAPGHLESTPGSSSGAFYRLDLEGFGNELHRLLVPCVVGYSMQLRRHGRILLSRQWGWARTRYDGNVEWTARVPMHVASVSKLISAMAMTKLLADHGVSVDSVIAPWLPTYWQVGPNADQITFRHLLTHTSGLNYKIESSRSDILFMREQVALGAANLGKESWYQNLNFGLFRVLMVTLTQAVAPSFTVAPEPERNDQYWDLLAIAVYKSYVSDLVFDAAGVSGPTLDHPDSNALAYTFPVEGRGWDSGDLSTMSGGCGWHLSTSDLLDVMGAFRRGLIVGAGQAQSMLDDGFGLDLAEDTLLGRMYAKGGVWGDADKHIEQSNAYFLPKGMELVILANSAFCRSADTFMEKVTAAINNSIKFNPFSVLAGIYWAVRDRVTRERARIPR